MSRKRFLFTPVFLVMLSVLPGMAAVRLAPPLGEHMVLQQGVPVPIWGTGAPGGDTVRVSIAGRSVTATSDWEGRWMVVLAPMKAGGPYQMLIQVGGRGPVIPSSAANDRGGAELNDVLVGELRVLPHRSATLRPARSSEHAGSHLSGWVRLYKRPAHPGDDAQSPVPVRWTVASLDPAPNLSTASYDFARELRDQLHVPVGVIETEE
jgi:sialate O-acetylesterase